MYIAHSLINNKNEPLKTAAGKDSGPIIPTEIYRAFVSIYSKAFFDIVYARPFTLYYTSLHRLLKHNGSNREITFIPRFDIAKSAAAG